MITKKFLMKWENTNYGTLSENTEVQNYKYKILATPLLVSLSSLQQPPKWAPSTRHDPFQSILCIVTREDFLN